MGWIEVVVGPMFSGKSEELIRRLRRAEIGKQRVQIFKPLIDQRYAKNGIVSHSGLEIASELVQTGNDILDKVQARTEVVGIDEAQFLGESLVEGCVKLADLGKRVIVAGLDTEFLGRPFGPTPPLLAGAEETPQLRRKRAPPSFKTALASDLAANEFSPRWHGVPRIPPRRVPVWALSLTATFVAGARCGDGSLPTRLGRIFLDGGLTRGARSQVRLNSSHGK